MRSYYAFSKTYQLSINKYKQIAETQPFRYNAKTSQLTTQSTTETSRC